MEVRTGIDVTAVAPSKDRVVRLLQENPEWAKLDPLYQTPAITIGSAIAAMDDNQLRAAARKADEFASQESDAPSIELQIAKDETQRGGGRDLLNEYLDRVNTNGTARPAFPPDQTGTPIDFLREQLAG